MQVHFIGLGEVDMYNLAMALHKKGETIIGSDTILDESLISYRGQGVLPEELGWFPEKISERLNTVVVGARVEASNPELTKAKELGLQIVSYPEFLYEQSKYKTRVVIAGSLRKASIASMILHVLEYNDVEVDYALTTPNGISLSESNDFIVIEGRDNPSSSMNGTPQFHVYRPNIALLSDIQWDERVNHQDFGSYAEQYRIFVDSIVKGGSITYNEEDVEVKKLVESSENPIRKFPYVTPAHQEEDGKVYLDTPDGEMPLEISGGTALSNLAGVKWICQQMGVDEVEFYEAVATYKNN